MDGIGGGLPGVRFAAVLHQIFLLGLGWRGDSKEGNGLLFFEPVK